MTATDEKQGKGTGGGTKNLQKNHLWKQNLGDNAVRLKKELEMNAGSEEEQINLEQDTTLHNTNKWTT